MAEDKTKRKSGDENPESGGPVASANPFAILRKRPRKIVLAEQLVAAPSESRPQSASEAAQLNAKESPASGRRSTTAAADGPRRQPSTGQGRPSAVSAKQADSKRQPLQTPKDNGWTDPDTVSTFQPSDANVLASTNVTLIGMNIGEKICFHGAVLLCPIQGSFSVMGYNFAPPIHRVSALLRPSDANRDVTDALRFYPCFSPKSHSLLVIESTGTSTQNQRPDDARQKPRNTASDPTLTVEIAGLLKSANFSESTTIIAMRSLAWANHSGLEKTGNAFRGLFGMGSEKIPMDPNFKLRGFFPITMALSSASALKVPPTWFDFGRRLKIAHAPPITCVVGSKNVGKSTFSRYAVNSLLERYPAVAYMECDIGQSELTPSGIVSLHVVRYPLLSPPFVHLQEPYHAYYLGASTPKDDPDHYVNCLEHLYRTYQKTLRTQGMPLIVNTHGWIRGIGYDLMQHLLGVIDADYVAQLWYPPGSTMLSKNLPENFDHTVTETNPNCQLVRVEGFEDRSLKPKLSSADLRTLATISYFAKSNLPTGCPREGLDCERPIWCFSKAAAEETPYQVPWSSVRIKFINFDVPYSQTLRALNGCVVALVVDRTKYCRVPAESHRRDHPFSSLRIVPSQLPLRPQNHKCVGLGLVRSIDPEQGLFHIVSPVAPTTLGEVNMLVRASGTETPAYLSLAGYMSVRVDLPYTTYSMAEGVGSLSWKRRAMQRRKNMSENRK